MDERNRKDLSGGYSLSGRPGDSMNLLQELVEHSIDDDYYVAAERREQAEGRRQRPVLTVVAVAAFAAIITVAAVQTYDQRPQTEVEREALVTQIKERENSIANLRESIGSVGDEVESLEAGASDPEFDERTKRESIAVGRVAVTGPGARIIVDNADDAEDEPQGRIRDTDLQLLANGLWNAGAEAIAINGQRITTLSSIRTAGEAVTVNYRSLSAPYTVHAIGNMDTLAARFIDTQAGATWSALSNNYGVQFEVSSVPDVTLPAAPKGRVSLRHAKVKGESG